MRRLLDIFFGLLVSLILLPLLIIVAIMIKFDSHGPVFFISERIGIGNKRFKMYKFRTMFTNTEIIETSKIKNPNSKITKIGKILRKYSIDEVPQFLNLILGNMTIVGPRPALPQQIKLINNRKKFGIHKIKPGVTGYAQVHGRDLITDSKKLKLEIEYIKNRSFYLDLKIILKTFIIVFSKKGVSH